MLTVLLFCKIKLLINITVILLLYNYYLLYNCAKQIPNNWTSLRNIESYNDIVYQMSHSAVNKL